MKFGKAKHVQKTIRCSIIYALNHACSEGIEYMSANTMLKMKLFNSRRLTC